MKVQGVADLTSPEEGGRFLLLRWGWESNRTPKPRWRLRTAATQDVLRESALTLGPGLGAQVKPRRQSVTQDSCKGREKRAKGTRADGYIRQPGGVPDHHMGSLGKCQSQARLHALLEVLAAAPEIKPASQEWALHGDMQDMDPRMYRNPGKSPQVATPTGFKPVMPTS